MPLRAFQRAIDGMRTLPLRPERVAQKRFFVFWNKRQLQSNKVRYKVSLYENFQRQNCSTAIPLSKGPQMLARTVTLQPKILPQSDPPPYICRSSSRGLSAIAELLVSLMAHVLITGSLNYANELTLVSDRILLAN